jgi:hypothetical protein
MYEFYIEHIHCGMTSHIYGYSVNDAFRRSKKDPSLWRVVFADYID